MGLLCTTHITNKNTIVDNSALTAATNKVAQATERVAKANQNIADAIKEDKVTITHDRYAELLNKEKLLGAIKSTIFSHLTMLLPAMNTTQYKKYKESFMMGAYDKVLTIDECFKEDYCIGVNFKSSTACVYRFNKDKKDGIDYFSYTTMEDLGYDVVGVKEPVYISSTEGNSKITGEEYKRLLYIENILDTVYVKAIDVLPSVMFNILNCDYTKGSLDNNKKFTNAVYFSNNSFSVGGRKEYSIIPFVSHGLSWLLDCHNREIRVKVVE
jgi:hypothetical protein